ncbi:hemolysin family protein [Magnetococcales bacterium HHB-1]
MDLELLGKLVAILALVAGNAFFVGSEVAITAARRSKIKQLADMGNAKAKYVKLLHDEPTRFYAVTQIGITLVSLGLGAIGMDTIADLTDPMFVSLFGLFGEGDSVIRAAEIVSWTVAFLFISFLHVVGGELAPKVLAYHKSIQMSMAVGYIINAMYIVMIPVIWVMNHASNTLLIFCGQGDIVGGSDGHGDSSAISGDEIGLIIAASASSGTIDKDQARMLTGVFDLDEENAEAAMVPKTDVHGLQKTATVSDALSYFATTNHRRYPVFDGDKIVGVVPIKRLIHVLEHAKSDVQSILSESVTKIMREDPFFIPSATKLSQVMKDLRTNRRQFGVVVDEYGQMIGVLTPENILSRLVGEYHDEFAPVSRNINKLKGSQWEIRAGVRVADLELLLDFPFPTDPSYITLAGLMFSKIGRVPEVGDVVELDNGRLQILEIDNLRITKVLFQIMAVDKKGNWNLSDQNSPADDD